MTIRPLGSILAEIADPRRGQGRKYPLLAILNLLCVGFLCGHRTYKATVTWGRHLGRRILRALGFAKGRVPCVSTVCYLLQRLDLAGLEAKLQQWAEEVLQALPPAQGEPEPLSLDGKTLRGSRRQGALNVHLLSVLGTRLGVTVLQQPVDDKTNEGKAALELLKALVLKDRILTLDAAHTQRETAHAIVTAQGDYVMVVKDNQPELRADIAYLFRMPWRPVQPQAETLDKGHGRIEGRRLTTSPIPPDYLDWPGAQQIFRLERSTYLIKPQKTRHEVVYGITSLCPDQANASRLLALARGHWDIENRSHWVRDVTLGEDACQVHAGSTPQVLAALRNATIGFMRVTGIQQLAESTRRFLARPLQAVRLLLTG